MSSDKIVAKFYSYYYGQKKNSKIYWGKRKVCFKYILKVINSSILSRDWNEQFSRKLTTF